MRLTLCSTRNVKAEKGAPSDLSIIIEARDDVAHHFDKLGLFHGVLRIRWGGMEES